MARGGGEGGEKKVQSEGEDEEGSEDEVDDASKLAQSLAVWAGLVRQRHGRRCSSHIFSSVRGLGLWGLLGPFLGGGSRSCSRERWGEAAS